MKKFLLLTIVSILMLATLVHAHDEESEFNQFLEIHTEDLSEEETIQAQKDAIMDNLQKIAEKVNEQVGSLPGIAKSIIGNTKVNVYFEGDDVIGLELADGKIKAIQKEEIEKQVFNVYISDKVFVSLNDNAFDLGEALKNKDIRYEGLGFFGKIKSGFLTAALKLFM